MTRWLTMLALTSCSALAELPMQASLAAGHTEPAVAGLVGSLLASYHYEGRPVDDRIAAEWMDTYLSNLDFNHSVFLQSDIEEFRGLSSKIDDELRTGRPKLEIATTIYERYQKRMAERLAEAKAILDAPIDLTNDEDYRFDRKDASWPATPADAQEIWRKRIEEQFILGDQAKRSEDDTRDLLKKRYHRLGVDVASAEPMDILERYLTALTTVYDPHTIYFKPASQDTFDIEMANSLEGIGASLRTQGEYTVVMGLIAGGPAEKDGVLQQNDKIIAVGQGSEKPVDVIDLPIDKVVKQIRGKKGTEVRLTVLPADATDPSQTRIVTIIRDKVVLADSDAELHIHEVGGKRYARIDIPSFYADVRGKRSASRDLERILRDEMGTVDGVILDFRQNGGGSLQEAVDMTGLFIKKGPVVQIRDQNDKTETLFDTENKVAWDGPLMVLTSPLSASASEIVAGAIQDYGRGIIVGSKTTHGKGSVQTVIGLSEMMARFTRGEPPAAGALKLTTQKFYRINGASTQVKGVQADVVLPSPWDGLDIYEGDLDHALAWDEIEPVAYTPVGDVNAILPGLQTRSDKRVRKSEDFEKMAKDTAERMKLKESKTVSLNLEKRRAELAARGVEPTEEPEEEGKQDQNDFILDEALAVMLDYTR